MEIKWTRKLLRQAGERRPLVLSPQQIIPALYRPFVRKRLYFASELNEDTYQLNGIFQTKKSSPAIVFTDTSPRAPFSAIACDTPFEHHLAASSDSFQCVGLYRYDEVGTRHDNITDWALKQFASHYKAGPGKRLPEPDKEGIFHYVYAALHDPAYRETYVQNLKREFPRIPLHGATRADFWRWAGWGRALMALHLGYETVDPWPLTRCDVSDEKARAVGLPPKCLLKAEPAAGRILVDSETTLSGIPPEAWTYRLGNRSAVDWVLDQHKQKKPKDPTIREKFDTYRFADHKERVIDLLARVTRVSVETMAIVTEIAAATT